jgi:nitrogen-specific signal transduction histidine kinase
MPLGAWMTAISPALARSVFDDAPDAMIIIDAFGTIWFANRRVCDLFGYRHSEMIGESIEKLMPERTLVAAAIRDVTERKRAEAELVVARDAIEAMREQLQTLALLTESLREHLRGQHAAQALSQQAQTIDTMSGSSRFSRGPMTGGAGALP